MRKIIKLFMESGSFRKLIYWLLPILMLFWDTFFHGIEYLLFVIVHDIPKEVQDWGRLGWFRLGYITLIMTIVPISLGYIYLGLLYKFKQYAKRITIIACSMMFLFITIADIYLAFYRDLESDLWDLWVVGYDYLYYLPFFLVAYYLLRRMDKGVKED